MSFDLAVLALDADADADDARTMLGMCQNRQHPEGELDERIVTFYEELRVLFPDSGPRARTPDSPWTSTPLNVGIDHVIMHLSYSSRSAPAIGKIHELAARHGLAIYDPQSSEIHHPGN